MKFIVPLTLAAALLCGCPETKIPTPPPRVPEPKVDTSTSQSMPTIQIGGAPFSVAMAQYS